MSERLIIWGAGELGLRVARRWLTRPGLGPVLGYTQTTTRHPDLKAAGVQPHTGSPTEVLTPEDYLLLAIPGHTNQQAAVASLQKQSVAPPARAVLISVTGYYGELHGFIRNDSPQGEGSRPASIAAAEQVFRSWSGAAGVILRAGGLYSSTRGPFAALARRGNITRHAPADKIMALIHYDDLATAVVTALLHPAPEPVYLAVTPPCPTRQEFYTLACKRLGLPLPDMPPPTGAPPATFDVSTLRRDLLSQPAYPDWRSAIVDHNPDTRK
jgi:nucleoside-diphosphate-sugar epimerase